MHMRMAGMGDAEHHGGYGPPMIFFGFVLFQWLFMVASVVCFLGALNRGANALKLESRIRAYKTVPDAFTDEEREVLIHKITTRALGSH